MTYLIYRLNLILVKIKSIWHGFISPNPQLVDGNDIYRWRDLAGNCQYRAIRAELNAAKYASIKSSLHKALLAHVDESGHVAYCPKSVNRMREIGVLPTADIRCSDRCQQTRKAIDIKP